MLTNPVLGPAGKAGGVEFFQGFIPGLIGLAFVAGSIIFFFMLAIGAIQWITSEEISKHWRRQGEESQTL